MFNKYSDVLKKLLKLWQNTPKHYEGKILGSMTTYPHPLAIYAYNLFIHTNYSDPVIFKTIKVMEKELIEGLNTLYQGEGHGFITSGGTESNFLALLSAYRNKGTRENVVIAPDTVHVSVDKACYIMGCRVVKIPTNNKPVKISVLEEYIRKYKPYAIVITAGTTERGLIDPVKEAAEVAYNTNTYLHIDAAYGGLLIPFLYKHGYLNQDLLFYEGISSISVDFHKNGLTPIPSSIILFSEEKYIEHICFETNYMLSNKTCGLLGTRPGASVAAMWSMWKYFGFKGFEKLSLKLIDIAYKLYNGLRTINGIYVYEPILPIIVFKHYEIAYDSLLLKLLEKGFYLYKSPSLSALRIVVMPHMTLEHVKIFLDTLREILKSYINKY